MEIKRKIQERNRTSIHDICYALPRALTRMWLLIDAVGEQSSDGLPHSYNEKTCIMWMIRMLCYALLKPKLFVLQCYRQQKYEVHTCPCC